MCIKSVLNKFQYLSFDVVIGAVASTGMVAKLLEVKPPALFWYVLASSVWCVYASDHLFDVINHRKTFSSKRRIFFVKNFNIILLGVILIAISDVLLSIFIFPFRFFIWGLVLAFFTLIYLLLVFFKRNKKHWYIQKEFFVAIIYSTGIWIFPIFNSKTINIIDFVFFVIFFLIVWASILLIAIFEINADKKDNFSSFPISKGKKMSYFIIKMLLIISLILIATTFITSSSLLHIYVSIFFLLMTISLYLILKFEKQFSKNNIYRFWIEAVFYLPFFIYLL